jgi:hypothetical protein
MPGGDHQLMPNMSAKAADLNDPCEMLERIIYRNARMLDRLDEKDDPVAFVRLMAGHNRTDLRRLAELLECDTEHLSSK